MKKRRGEFLPVSPGGPMLCIWKYFRRKFSTFAILFILKKMGWATLSAIFSQTHLFTLLGTLIIYFKSQEMAAQQ
jgi:hypothetical protein